MRNATEKFIRKGVKTLAERRMFTKKITESDAFLDMPMSTQCLYFHLNMSADDDGFVNNPRKIQRMIGSSEDDLKLLMAKSFILSFDSGVIVIKHWKMHNYIQSDRYKPTDYVEEKSMLHLKKNKAYSLNGNEMYTECIQDVSVGKDSIDKNIYGEVSGDTSRCKKFIPPSVDEVRAYCQERNNKVDAQSFVDFYESKGWYVGKNKMKDWKAAVRTWEKSDNQKSKTVKTTFNNIQQRDYAFDELEKKLLANNK